jgi:hypothetical protein
MRPRWAPSAAKALIKAQSGLDQEVTKVQRY